MDGTSCGPNMNALPGKRMTDLLASSFVLCFVLYSVWYEQQGINTKVLLLARRKSKDVPNISQVKAI